jgi:two-component system sensor histidine kinase VicK
VGRTSEIIIAREQGGEIFVVHHSQNSQTLKSYPLGVLDDPFIKDSPVAKAVMGEEGSLMTRDDRGRKVLVAYRYAETLGWGMLVQVESGEAMAGVTMLAFALIAISVLLLALAGMVGFFFARRLTEPLLHLVGKIRVLRPGHWTFRLSIRTGDEVEMLDQVIADLTSRLQATYERLEGQVADKTQALQKQVTFDRAILEGIEYGVLATDATGKITDTNEAVSRLLGFGKDELLGKPATDVLKIHYQKGMFANNEHPATVCLRDKATFRAPPSMHLTVLRKNQTLLPVMLMVTPLMQENVLLGSIIIFLDVTEERQTDYMKSEFISLASHQLRTPLSSLRWYLELLTGDTDVQLTTEQKEYLGEVQKASSQMASLLDTLLRVARLDEGGMMIERKEVDVVDLLARLFDEIRQGNRDSRLNFVSELPKTPLVMSTDPVLLPIVVQNLITNAMKYSPQGGTITISIKDENGMLNICVADQGVGIPPEEQERVFEKFFRAKNIRHMLTSGTGLGLYLSKRIMDSLGGRLTFVSTQGKGTVFTATIPKE